MIAAAATVVYAFITLLLWLQTKKAANAATISAKAAKQSADVAAALHRPFIGLVPLRSSSAHGDPHWSVPMEVRNFGTLPAVHVNAVFEFYLGDTPLKTLEGPINEPTAAEIFPGSAHMVNLPLFLNANNLTSVTDGRSELVIKLRATYATANGPAFEYTAEAPYDVRGRRFFVQKSETRELVAAEASPRTSSV